jgi:hypothetical protein
MAVSMPPFIPGLQEAFCVSPTRRCSLAPVKAWVVRELGGQESLATVAEGKSTGKVILTV